MTTRLSGTPQIFERHVELSRKRRVSGVYEVWICNRGSWRKYRPSLVSQQRLSRLAECYGEQVGPTQWDFPDRIESPEEREARHSQAIIELGFEQYMEV